MAKITAATNEKKMQDIHARKYLATIHLLPDLRQKRTKEYLQLTFTLIALIVALVFAINPTLTTISDLNKQLTDARKVEEQLQTKITHLSQLNIQYNALQSTLPQIYSAIPQTQNPQDVIAQLQGLIQSHHLEVQTLTTAPADALLTIKDRAPSLSVNLTVLGKYEDVRTFLQDIINFQRIFTIDTTLLTKVPEQNLLLVSLSGKVYYYK